MGDVLGGFEHRVLLTMMRLGASAYTAPIVRELEAATGDPISPSAVYVTLRRLEKRGLVTSRMEEPAPGVGGRPRRVFDVTGEAVRVLRTTREELDRLWDGVEVLDLP